MNLEEIATKLCTMNLGEQEEYLISIGRKQHIEYETGESSKLSEANPERFERVGSRTIDRAKYEGTDEEYRKSCISNAEYLYERFPIIFEFYDELVNGITLQDEAQQNIK